MILDFVEKVFYSGFEITKLVLSDSYCIVLVLAPLVSCLS
jgi:hypothetical protein